MKKILAYLLCCLLLLAAPALAERETLKVTATFYPLYTAALNIIQGVDGVALFCLAPPEAGCLHDYQMTTADRRLLGDSDVVILNGAGLEEFLDKLLPELSGAVLDAGHGIEGLPDAHGGVNAHFWVSVEGMMAQVRNIAEGLSARDPANAAKYRENADAYLEKLSALQEEMKEALAPFAGAPIVTFHEAFDYFAEAFGLRVVAVIQEEHGDAPSARKLAEVAEIIGREGVSALFAEVQYEDTSVRTLARETGVAVYVLDPAVSSEADPEDLDGYLRIMRENLKTLVEALS